MRTVVDRWKNDGLQFKQLIHRINHDYGEILYNNKWLPVYCDSSIDCGVLIQSCIDFEFVINNRDYMWESYKEFSNDHFSNDYCGNGKVMFGLNFETKEIGVFDDPDIPYITCYDFCKILSDIYGADELQASSELDNFLNTYGGV